MVGREENEPRVTVIVTCYNQAQWIEQALESLTVQTERSIELIVTDDGSTDASVDVISQWLNRHDIDGQLIQTDENVGLPAMLNRAWERVRGRYTVILNGDDWMDPGRLAAQADVLDRADPGVALVYSNLVTVDPDGIPKGEVFPPWTHESVEGDTFARYLEDPARVCMGLVMFRSDILDTIGPWDESLVADDFDFLLRVAAAGFEFRHLPMVVLTCRQHETSLSRSRGPELVEDRLMSLRKLVGSDESRARRVLKAIEGCALSLHGIRYDRGVTRRHLRFALMHSPSRRVARALVENYLHLPPGLLARGYHRLAPVAGRGSAAASR